MEAIDLFVIGVMAFGAWVLLRPADETLRIFAKARIPPSWAKEIVKGFCLVLIFGGLSLRPVPRYVGIGLLFFLVGLFWAPFVDDKFRQTPNIYGSTTQAQNCNNNSGGEQ